MEDMRVRCSTCSAAALSAGDPAADGVPRFAADRPSAADLDLKTFKLVDS